jgi:YbbR domain-containing protein
MGSLFLAILIWFFVAMTKRYTAAVRIPVVIKTEGASRTVSSDYPEKIAVKLEGEGWKLLSLYLGRIEWVIDLRTEVRRNVLDIQTAKNAMQYIKPLPEGITILEVLPTSFTLELDEKISKRVPIAVAANIEPADGYLITSALNIQPDSVTITGGKSIVGSLKEWKTSRSELRGVTNDFQLDLLCSDSLNGLVDISENKVKVKGIAEPISEAEFRDVPIMLVKTKKPIFITLIPNRVSLTLSGTVGDLVKVRAESLSVSIDLEKIILDTTGFVVPTMRLPKGLKLRHQSPEKVQYILRN